MPTFRDIKRKARQRLHSRLSEPVVYVRDAGKPSEVKVSLKVRLHLNFVQVGELLRGGYADMEELNPTVVFMSGGAAPVEKAIVVTRDFGAWRIVLVKPPNDITVSAEVVRLTDRQILELGWDGNLDYMGLGTPNPIDTLDPMYAGACHWTEDDW